MVAPTATTKKPVRVVATLKLGPTLPLWLTSQLVLQTKKPMENILQVGALVLPYNPPRPLLASLLVCYLLLLFLYVMLAILVSWSCL